MNFMKSLTLSGMLLLAGLSMMSKAETACGGNDGAGTAILTAAQGESDRTAAVVSKASGAATADSLPVLYPVFGNLPELRAGTPEEWTWAIKEVDKGGDWTDKKKYNEQQLRLLDDVAEGRGPATRGIGCSWYCCAWPDTIYDSGHTGEFTGKNLHDLNLLTPWMVNADDAIGSSVTIGFPAGVSRITTIEIWDGSDRESRDWFTYGKVAEIKLLVNGVPMAYLELSNTVRCQKFGIKPLTSPDKETPLRLTFEITKIYPGKNDKVVLSEINFDGIDCH